MYGYQPELHVMLIESQKIWIYSYRIGNLVQLLLFVIQVEIEDQPPIVEEIGDQVQDAANVAFQEGLLLEEEMAEEQWHLKDSVMSAFKTIFQGYKTINSGFMDMTKLIDATPLHAMGQILNDIQESAARLVGYGEGEGVWKMREKQKKLRRWGRAERRVGRGLKEKRSMMMVMMTVPTKFQKENQHPKKGRLSAYKRTALLMFLLAHHMT